jgi:hypothetical protein
MTGKGKLLGVSSAESVFALSGCPFFKSTYFISLLLLNEKQLKCKIS